MAFPKLPDLVPPPPTGPTFDPNTYKNLVTSTLQPGEAELDGLQNGIDALRALTVAAELDGVGWVSDFDEIDAALGDIGDIQWGSPEPDFGPVTDYLAARRDEIMGKADSLGDVPGITLALPGGHQGPTLGGPPAAGGQPTVGSAPYVLHYPLILNVAAPGALVSATLNGPNPPFVALQGFAIETNAQGGQQSFAHILINPAQVGTFTATLVYVIRFVTAGIPTELPATETVKVQVVQ